MLRASGGRLALVLSCLTMRQRDRREEVGVEGPPLPPVNHDHPLSLGLSQEALVAKPVREPTIAKLGEEAYKVNTPGRIIHSEKT